MTPLPTPDELPDDYNTACEITAAYMHLQGIDLDDPQEDDDNDN